MNFAKILFLSLLCCCASNRSLGQWRHFPQGHEAVFLFQGAYVKAKFDSSIIYPRYQNGGMDSTPVLLDYNLRYCPEN
ncbi:MAG: hypothetical protein LPK45_02675, partial [Bacteroidota bacterium]|nr:hypothetical protein [Bacteroidota bacterium]MDX5429944.1 hypothetical protein [Bacteroidota bacterium]MDX5468717.1 hypothetical protein [Bacteroidota bacterium]